MSYDISLYADLGNGPVSVGSLDENYTWNLGDFIETVTGKRLGDWNGADAWELRDAIVEGLERMNHFSWKDNGNQTANVDYFRKFEPENGWGSVFGAIVFLTKIAVGCAKAPNAKVCVS